MGFGPMENLKSIIHILKRKTERLINLTKITQLETSINCQIQSVAFIPKSLLSIVTLCLLLKKSCSYAIGWGGVRSGWVGKE